MKVRTICAVALLGTVTAAIVTLTVPGDAAEAIETADYKDQPDAARYNSYKVITGSHLGPFSDKVTHALRGGWEPAGGATFVNGMYLQAVTK